MTWSYEYSFFVYWSKLGDIRIWVGPSKSIFSLCWTMLHVTFTYTRDLSHTMYPFDGFKSIHPQNRQLVFTILCHKIKLPGLWVNLLQRNCLINTFCEMRTWQVCRTLADMAGFDDPSSPAALLKVFPATCWIQREMACHTKFCPC